MLSLLLLIILLTVIGFGAGTAYFFFKQNQPPAPPIAIQSAPENSIRYVALGDSYTIGEGVSEKSAWPAQLVDQLNQEGLKITLVANPSRTGYTTQNLIDHELPVFDESQAEFVTVMIGANDYAQGVNRETFQKNFSFILDHLLKTVSKDHILVITIPDYSVTSYSQRSSTPAAISQGIQLFNTLIQQEAQQRNIQVVDIFTLSQEMGKDTRLVHNDGVHPSEKGYSAWVEVIKPKVKTLHKKQTRAIQ